MLKILDLPKSPGFVNSLVYSLHKASEFVVLESLGKLMDMQ
jgi:hypothetical protein